jgi:hypothetical protein
MDVQSGLPVIATVEALAPENYHVVDGGAAGCPNGDPGHMVHLIAVREPLRNPLREATVDMRTGDLCFLRMGARVNAPAGVVGANGVAELDLADQNGYALVQKERIDFDLRTIGIAVKHFEFDVAFSNFAFPPSISPVVFTTPSPSPHPK